MRPTRMTKAMTLVALAGALTISACGGGDKPAKSSAGGSQGSGASAPAAVKVNIASFKFLSQTVSVKAGGKVTFVNHDSAPHTATASSTALRSSFNTDTLKNTESRAVTFDKPGKYAYFCVFHPFMTGTVMVK